MKRIRGACKGCKCAAITEFGTFQCMAMPDKKKIKKFPTNCKHRIDSATSLEDKP